LHNPVVVGWHSVSSAPALLQRARQIAERVIVVGPQSAALDGHLAGFDEVVTERCRRADIDAVLQAARALGADHVVVDETVGAPAKLLHDALVAAARYLRDTHAPSLAIQVVRSSEAVAGRPYRRIVVAADGAVGSGFAAIRAARVAESTRALLHVAMLERRSDLSLREAVSGAVATDPTFDLHRVRRGAALRNRRLEQARELIEAAGIDARYGWVRDDPAAALRAATTRGGYGLVVSGLMGLRAHGRNRSRTAVTREMLEATAVDHLLVLDSISVGVSPARRAGVLVGASAALLLGVGLAQPAAAAQREGTASGRAPATSTAATARENSVAAGAAATFAGGTTTSGRPVGLSVDTPSMRTVITVPKGASATIADVAGTVSSGPHHLRRNVLFVAVGGVAAEDAAAARATLRLGIHPDAELRTAGFEDGAVPPEGAGLSDTVLWLKHKLVNATEDATTTVFLVSDEAHAGEAVSPRLLDWALHNDVVVHTYLLASGGAVPTVPASGLEALSASTGGTFHRSDAGGFLEDLVTTRPAQIAAASVSVNGRMPIDVTGSLDPTGRWVLPRTELPAGLATVVATVYAQDGTTLSAYVDVTVTADAGPTQTGTGSPTQPPGETAADSPTGAVAARGDTPSTPPAIATEGTWATSVSGDTASAASAVAAGEADLSGEGEARGGVNDGTAGLPVTGAETLAAAVAGALALVGGAGLVSASRHRRT